MRALVVVGVLAVLALAFVTAALLRDTQRGSASGDTCPAGFKRANVALREPKDVKINVFNATDTVGLANGVATDFKNRKFQVIKQGNDKKRVEEVAVLRFGPKGVASAHLLKAYFLNEATPEYDPNRDDETVDVVIGGSYTQLATTTEVNQALSAAGAPTLPEGTCAAKEGDN
ncbi:LytR C-terminal domain-containing protein [Micromonospora sp. NPDC050417]|uniref:LytR C-terminal domain-containing protein n=1 Tax=Micromonospora sp. NPDC050417 TaxID=3364280 RepID=UPI0037A25A67